MDTAMEQAARKARTDKNYIRCLDELIGAALQLDNEDDAMYDALCSIIVRADAGWRCPSCRGINYHDDLTCNNCKTRKPKDRTIPKIESRIWDKENA